MKKSGNLRFGGQILRLQSTAFLKKCLKQSYQAENWENAKHFFNAVFMHFYVCLIVC